ncbi:PREDICTED: protein FAM124A-like, partial [Pterocles gutturalis]|uniref:protein FAM124A-like n=1 Tax=Pterocles gutturalis TaxID=240206 RepID=UPI0005284DE5
QARSWCRKSAKQNKQPYPSVSTDSRFTTLPAFPPQSHRSVPEHPKEMGQNKVHHANGLGHYLGFSQQDLRHSGRGDFTSRSSSASSISWSFKRSKSLFCLPTVNSSASETFNFSEPFQFLNTGSPATRLKTWRCSPRLNVDDLEGAQETDVDTGMKLSFSDLSVVSAYSALNGFCSDLEGSLPPQKQTVSKAKQAATNGRPVSAMCNTFDSVDGSLPFLSEWSSSSFTSASLSKPPKHSSRAAPCSLDGRGSICPASPADEEEFYI